MTFTQSDEGEDMEKVKADVKLCSAETARKIIETGDSEKIKGQWDIIATEIINQINNGDYSVCFSGFLYEANKHKLESLGYKVSSGTQYNENFYCVSWKRDNWEKEYKGSDNLESLKSEYNAYHLDNDYWRGIKYAIDVMEKKND